MNAEDRPAQQKVFVISTNPVLEYVAFNLSPLLRHVLNPASTIHLQRLSSTVEEVVNPVLMEPIVISTLLTVLLSAVSNLLHI